MRHVRHWSMLGELLATAGLVTITGCSDVKRIEPPELEPDAVAAHAMQLYDQDSDGKISRSECQQCPPLFASFRRYDTSPADGALAAEEISGRLQAMLGTRLGQMPCYAEVTMDGQPLADASVRLVPDPIFGSALSEATGTTSYKGLVRFTRANAPVGTPGVQFGLYRVEITHPTIALPKRYNTQTQLGMEVSPLERDGDSATFALRSGSR